MPNLSKVCIDANLVLRIVSRPTDRWGSRVRAEWEAEAWQPVAPLLLRYEVTNALHRLRHQGLLSTATATTLLGAAIALPIQLFAGDSLHSLAFELAGQFQLPASYDAHYLALARQLQVPFWTADQRLARTVAHHLPWVHLISDGE